MALNKSDIQGKHASLNKSIRRPSQGEKSLKNAQSKRTILLDQYAFNAVNEMMQTKGKYVFGGEYPLLPTNIERHFMLACRDAGVQKVRIHDLRHSFVSNAILNGANIVAVSKYVGHKNVTTTLDQYSHLLNNSEADLIEKMERIY